MFVVCLKDTTRKERRRKKPREDEEKRTLMLMDVAQANSFFSSILLFVAECRSEKREMSPIFQLVPRQNTSIHPTLPLSRMRTSFKS